MIENYKFVIQNNQIFPYRVEHTFDENVEVFQTVAEAWNRLEQLAFEQRNEPEFDFYTSDVALTHRLTCTFEELREMRSYIYPDNELMRVFTHDVFNKGFAAWRANLLPTFINAMRLALFTFYEQHKNSMSHEAYRELRPNFEVLRVCLDTTHYVDHAHQKTYESDSVHPNSCILSGYDAPVELTPFETDSFNIHTLRISFEMQTSMLQAIFNTITFIARDNFYLDTV